MQEIKFKERQKEISIQVAVAVSALLLGFLFAVRPFFEETRFLKQKINLSKEKLKLYEDSENAKAKLGKLEGFFLLVAERPLILAKISDAASKEKLDIDTLSPKTMTGENYLKLLMEVNTRGNFFQLVKFLKSVDSFNPAIRINAVGFSRALATSRGKKTNKLQANISLETYLKQRAKKSNAL